MSPGGRELLVVSIVMGLLLIFAFVAVGIFIRVLRKERAEMQARNAEATTNSANQTPEGKP